MADPSEPYRARDRSLLLPFYKRWLVEPLVARLPATLSPNAITHLGHALNLAALLTLLSSGAQRGGALFVAALLVQLYVICDNADGAHARRTAQTSAYGELLDHGLDILNVAYIACIGAFALGLRPLAAVLLTALVTAASAITFFEQRATGTFVLGRLNQQESSLVLCGVLCVSGARGVDWWRHTSVWALSAQAWMLSLVALTIALGALGALWRVRARRGCRALSPVFCLLGWNVAVLVLAAAHIISPRVGLALALGANTFFASRMLARRLCRDAAPARLAGPPPTIERTMAATFIALVLGAALIVAKPNALPLTLLPHVDTALAVLAGALFAIAVLRDARRGLARVRG